MLRHAKAVSNLSCMETGTSFKPVIDDELAKNATKIVFLSGKYYYDVIAEREIRKLDDSVAVIRIEELCPFPWKVISDIVKGYKNAKDFVWVQEEHQNQGAWTFVETRLNQILSKPVFCDVYSIHG